MRIGNRYNSFVVLETKVQYNNRYMVKVQCDCGLIVYRRKAHLISGKSRYCKSCASKKTALKYGTPLRNITVGNLGKTYFSTLKYGAIRRGFEFNITQEYLWDILVVQDFKCALSGLPINISTDIKNHAPDYSKFTASVDRIDSKLGYIIGNVQWVHRDVNRLKNNLTEEYFIYLCTQVSNYANQQPSTSGMV